MTAGRVRPVTVPDDAAFRGAMRHFVGNVSLITAGLGADRSGLVATSAVPHSADPPTLLVCVNRQASLLPLLATYRHFGVSFLTSDHKELAERFSGRTGIKGEARFAGAQWLTKTTGAPLLADAPVAFDCALTETIERGTHVIVLGLVKAIMAAPGDESLVYWHGAYRSLAGKTL